MYLDEMEILQSKMREFEKNIQIKQTQSKNKMENVEPNMIFMKDWLDKTKKNNTMIEQLRLYSNQKRLHGNQIKTNSDLEQLDQFIYQTHGKVKCPASFNNKICYFGGIEKQINNYKNLNTDTQSEQEFMLSFVESIYNMFNIINKRLDTIERKLSYSTDL